MLYSLNGWIMCYMNYIKLLNTHTHIGISAEINFNKKTINHENTILLEKLKKQNIQTKVSP